MTTWPLIQRDDKSAPFFDAAAREVLVIRRCESCGQALPPEAAVCTTCGATGPAWCDVAGTGRLVSWTVVHRAPNRAYTDLVPYTVAIVELDEGPWLHARLETDSPSAGMALRAVFRHPQGSESYPVFTTV
ncbi:Zn-ribbon domain-containing OB-fold protein [Nonomuraea sp. NPDC050556]|uniref:Zn-ribbon domain-containing OB-fold protein n=1 Tax=Nonomuraea sp. NPDC050556 TaxID=3364369 RepID=UPI0037AB6865